MRDCNRYMYCLPALHGSNGALSHALSDTIMIDQERRRRTDLHLEIRRIRPHPVVAVTSGPYRRCSAATSMLLLSTLSAFLLSPRAVVGAFSLEATIAMTSFFESHRSGLLTTRAVPYEVAWSPLVLRASRGEGNSNNDGEQSDEEGERSDKEKKMTGGGGTGRGRSNKSAARNKEGNSPDKSRKKSRRKYSGGGGSRKATNSTSSSSQSGPRRSGPKQSGKKSGQQPNIGNISKRIAQLEGIVAGQSVEICKLRDECQDLREAAAAFAQVVELLRQAGLTMDDYEGVVDTDALKNHEGAGAKSVSAAASSFDASTTAENDISGMAYDYYEDEEIFGSAPSSVIDAADAAGAAILAALLAGKQRMLVDVRDAELSRDPDILVQFIELAVLPVAAGLEGIEGLRNRVKIVFPTVSQLLQYRRTMALAGSTEVVTLSTLGFDPVQEQDNLVVIIAPSPDDEEGIEAMNELLSPTDPKKEVSQPVVVLNHHMVPVMGVAAKFSVAYHLRLLSVQYMTGDMTPEYIQFLEKEKKERREKSSKGSEGGNANGNDDDDGSDKEGEEAQLEAAMNRAKELGVHHGITRAMVIRAYPRPWHVFVDTSPDSDADFEVAATFDKEPSQDDVNYAIVECLEGSETEDELVAQQMQAALESGQLNRVSEMLDVSPNIEIEDGNGNGSKMIQTNSSKAGNGDDDGDDDVEDGDDDDLFYDDFAFGEDSC